MKPIHQYIIGIDPGTETGLVVYNRTTKAIDLITSGTLLEMQYLLQAHPWNKLIKFGQVFVRMEDARLRTWIPKQKTETAERGRREGAGYVKAHCAIWEDFCKIWGIPYELVPPKNNKTKVKVDYFKMLTGWPGRTNDHERDAAMLCVGF
jgi:hypothetical protein